MGEAGGLEESLARQADIPFHAVASGQIRGRAPWVMARNLARMGRGAQQCAALIREFKPDVAFITGGYVAAPLAWAAARARPRVPLLIYLPDLTPGQAIRLDQPAGGGGCRLFSRGGAVFPGQGRGDRLSGASRTADGSQGHSPRRPEPGRGPAAAAGFRRQPRRPQHQSGAPGCAAAAPANLPGCAYQWTIGLAGDRGCGNADCGGTRGNRWPVGRTLSPVSLPARRNGAGAGGRRPGDRPGGRIGVGRIPSGRLAQHPGALSLCRAAPGRQRGLSGRPRRGAGRA